MHKLLKNKILLYIIGLSGILFLMPLLLWGGQYYIGGDDSRLYYMFPYEYLKNFTFSIFTDNTIGSFSFYYPQLYIAPFVFLILVVKHLLPFINTQLLFYGMNLAGGFICFYLFLDLFISNANYKTIAKLTASFIYSFSAFSFFTVWGHQLFALYLVSIFPLACFLFIKGVKENKISLILLDSLIVSVFSIVLLALPWLCAMLIATIPIFALLFWHYKKRFILYSLLMAVLVLGLNFYWIFHFIYSPFSSHIPISRSIIVTAQQKSVDDNSFLINAISNQNQLLYPFNMLFHKNLQKNFAWNSYTFFSEYHQKLLLLNTLFLFIVICAGVYQKGSKHTYTAFLYGWLISLYLFTVNITSLGIPLFIWLTHHIPGFVMFRNMFDKFGLALSFSYGSIFAISLAIVIESIKNIKMKLYIFLLVIVVSVINAYPFFFNKYNRNTFASTRNIYSTVTKLNSDFYDLINYIRKEQTTSSYIWFPIGEVNYTYISDENMPNHYYIGVSPIHFLTGKKDYTGSLDIPSDQNKQIMDAIQMKNANQLGKALQELNVNRIIVNNDISPELQNSYLFGSKLYKDQTIQLLQQISGNKLADFGKRYSIYEINNNFKSSLFSLSDQNAHLEFLKENDAYYTIHISHLTTKTQLIFHYPYHQQWELKFSGTHTTLTAPHTLVYHYANSWLLDPQAIRKQYAKSDYTVNPDGSLNLNLELHFIPQNYVIPTIIISACAALGTLIALVILLIRKKNDKR